MTRTLHRSWKGSRQRLSPNISGMDMSAVDLFHEIVSLCREHQCQLFLSSTKVNLRSLMIYVYAGIKGATEHMSGTLVISKRPWPKRKTVFLSRIFHLEEKKDKMESEQRRRARSVSHAEDGFVYAWKKMDEQHGIHII